MDAQKKSAETERIRKELEVHRDSPSKKWYVGYIAALDARARAPDSPPARDVAAPQDIANVLYATLASDPGERHENFRKILYAVRNEPDMITPSAERAIADWTAGSPARECSRVIGTALAGGDPGLQARVGKILHTSFKRNIEAYESEIWSYGAIAEKLSRAPAAQKEMVEPGLFRTCLDFQADECKRIGNVASPLYSHLASTLGIAAHHPDLFMTDEVRTLVEFLYHKKNAHDAKAFIALNESPALRQTVLDVIRDNAKGEGDATLTHETNDLKSMALFIIANRPECLKPLAQSLRDYPESVKTEISAALSEYTTKRPSMTRAAAACAELREAFNESGAPPAPALPPPAAPPGPKTP